MRSMACFVQVCRALIDGLPLHAGEDDGRGRGPGAAPPASSAVNIRHDAASTGGSRIVTARRASA